MNTRSQFLHEIGPYNAHDNEKLEFAYNVVHEYENKEKM